jgi:hypothetical protein
VKEVDFLDMLMVIALPILFVPDTDTVDALGMSSSTAFPEREPPVREGTPLREKEATIGQVRDPSSLWVTLPVQVAKVHTLPFLVSMIEVVGVLDEPFTLRDTKGLVSRLNAESDHPSFLCTFSDTVILLVPLSTL